MNKQEVIDYVMSTPYNVNRTILSQSLDEIGTQADWNQNDSTKADYVKNRTHYTETNETIYEVAIENGVFDTGTTTKEVAYAFFNNLENVTFTTEDGSIIAIADCEITNYGGYIIATLGELKLTIMVDPLWKFMASENGIFNLTLREEVVHKIPEKYLPDNIGGGTAPLIVSRCWNKDIERWESTVSFEEIKQAILENRPVFFFKNEGFDYGCFSGVCGFDWRDDFDLSERYVNFMSSYCYGDQLLTKVFGINGNNEITEREFATNAY